MHLCIVVKMYSQHSINFKMKYISKFFIVAVLFISSTLLAQDMGTDSREKMKFTVKGGFNYSNIYNTKTEELTSDGKLGFVGGIALNIPLGKFLGFQPEALISQKGFKGDGVLLGSRYNFTRTSTYIDFPLQIAIKPSEYFTLVAGPMYSYLINQKDVYSNTAFSFTQEQEINKVQIRKNVLGFVGGFDININHLTIGARVAYDLVDNLNDGSSNVPQYRNLLYQATVGYRLY